MILSDGESITIIINLSNGLRIIALPHSGRPPRPPIDLPLHILNGQQTLRRYKALRSEVRRWRANNHDHLQPSRLLQSVQLQRNRCQRLFASGQRQFRTRLHLLRTERCPLRVAAPQLSHYFVAQRRPRLIVTDRKPAGDWSFEAGEDLWRKCET